MQGEHIRKCCCVLPWMETSSIGLAVIAITLPPETVLLLCCATPRHHGMAGQVSRHAPGWSSSTTKSVGAEEPAWQCLVRGETAGMKVG